MPSIINDLIFSFPKQYSVFFKPLCGSRRIWFFGFSFSFDSVLNLTVCLCASAVNVSYKNFDTIYA